VAIYCQAVIKPDRLHNRRLPPPCRIAWSCDSGSPSNSLLLLM